MEFKEWLKLQEVGTGTSAIAVFSRPVFQEPVRRKPVEMMGFEKKKKK